MDQYLDWMIMSKTKVELTVDENFTVIPVYELYIECYSSIGITFRGANGIRCWYPMDKIIKIESKKEILIN